MNIAKNLDAIEINTRSLAQSPNIIENIMLSINQNSNTI